MPFDEDSAMGPREISIGVDGYLFYRPLDMLTSWLDVVGEKRPCSEDVEGNKLLYSLVWYRS